MKNNKKININNKFKLLLIWLGSIAATISIITVVCLTQASPRKSVHTDTTILTPSSPLVPSTSSESSVAYIIEPLLFSELDYVTIYDTAELEKYSYKVSACLAALTNALASYEYSQTAVSAMEGEYTRLTIVNNKLRADFDKYSAWEAEYYYATKTFLFLRKNGYNEAVACGIIGNMMIETSGGSLALKPNIYSPSRDYYGLCQWSLKYYSEIRDCSFEDQLEYLLSNIAYEFNTFGKKYKTGFKYEDFLNITDPAEAALAFAKSYERCGSASHALRKEAAIKAYEYFNLD